MAARISLRNPEGVHTPSSRYSHGALVEGAARRLLVSGQVGMAPDGTVPPDGVAQIDQALANLGAVLAAHGLGPRDIAKVTVFLTDRALIGTWRSRRDAFMEGHAPASTLLVVAGLADPRFLVEVEAEAVA